MQVLLSCFPYSTSASSSTGVIIIVIPHPPPPPSRTRSHILVVLRISRTLRAAHQQTATSFAFEVVCVLVSLFVYISCCCCRRRTGRPPTSSHEEVALTAAASQEEKIRFEYLVKGLRTRCQCRFLFGSVAVGFDTHASFAHNIRSIVDLRRTL